MNSNQPTQLPGDKVKKAIQLLSEILENHPERSRSEVLREVQIKLDLSPLECEFLNRHFK